MQETRGAALLLLVVLATLAFCLGRAALRNEGPPAFFVEERHGFPVALGRGFSSPGLHQFPDGTRPLDVIKMTNPQTSPKIVDDPLLQLPFSPGERLEISFSDSQVPSITREWISAGQRIALSIPLHPDRMSLEDWRVLPGVGVRLAEKIEEDRQKNGVFGSLAGLQRVKGIGRQRLEGWHEFFLER